MSERKEGWMRIPVLIVSGIILDIWFALVQILAIVHWFIVIIGGKRNKKLAEFCHIWTSQFYVFIKYMTFLTNEKPFPFTSLATIYEVAVKKKRKR